MEELLDFWPGIHEERLSVRLLQLEALVYGRNGGVLDVLYESCLILGRVVATGSIDQGVADGGGDVGLLGICEGLLLEFVVLGPATITIRTALHVSQLGPACWLKLKALGLPLLLDPLRRDGELRAVLPQALEEVLWAIALIQFHLRLFIFQICLTVASSLNIAGAHSHLADGVLLQSWQPVLVLIVLDLLEVYVPILQVIALDSSLISDLRLLQDLQEELKSYLH